MKKEIEPFKWYPSSIIPTEENIKRVQEDYDVSMNFLIAFRDKIEDYSLEEFTFQEILQDLEHSNFWLIFPDEVLNESIYSSANSLEDCDIETRPSEKLENFIYSSNNLGFLVETNYSDGLHYERLKDEDLVIRNSDDADLFHEISMAFAVPALPDDDDVQQMLAEYESES